jgi:N-acetylmuramoyl-L-alanine amidase
VGLLAGFGFLLTAQRGPAHSASNPLAHALLAGRTIAIDPGHGGWDPGAVGSRAREDQINLAVSLDLRRWFELAGARVVMTWSSMSQLPPQRRYPMQQRMELIHASDAGVLLDIHCNSGVGGRGPEVLYWEGGPSQLLAHDVLDELRYFTHTRRTVRRYNQYMLREAGMPAVNVELGFVSNPREEKLLMDPRYQNELAWYIFVGVERWYLKARWPASWLTATPPDEFVSR